MTTMVPCSFCARHVYATETTCPFCAAALTPQEVVDVAPMRASRSVMLAIGAAIAVVPVSMLDTTPAQADSPRMYPAPPYGIPPPPPPPLDAGAPAEDASTRPDARVRTPRRVRS